MGLMLAVTRSGALNGAIKHFDSVEVVTAIVLSGLIKVLQVAADLLLAAAAYSLVSEWEDCGLCVDDFRYELNKKQLLRELWLIMFGTTVPQHKIWNRNVYRIRSPL